MQAASSTAPSRRSPSFPSVRPRVPRGVVYHAGRFDNVVATRLIKTMGVAAGAAALAPSIVRAQGVRPLRRWPPDHHHDSAARLRSRGAPTTYFTDPDVLTVEPELQRPAPAERAHRAPVDGRAVVGGSGVEQPGRFLVLSDIPNNRQMRWLEDNGGVTRFRSPSNNSNGNTFDFQGRQLSCEHLTRRVVRYEHDGTITIIADKYNGKRLNSPNDVVAASRRQQLVHGSAVRRSAVRGHARRRRPGRAMPRAASSPRIGKPPEIGDMQARAADRRVSRRSERARGPGVGEDLCPIRTASSSPPTTRSSTSSAPARGPATRAGRQGRHVGVRRRHRQQGYQRQALQQLHGRWREVRAGRRALRRGRQSLVLEQCRAATSATAA